MTTSIFTEDEFWSSFAQDIQIARARVLIQSPFVTARRIDQLSKYFRSLTNRGVVICLFVQEPRHYTEKVSTLEPELAATLHKFKSTLAALRSSAVHVNLRRDIHAKLAVIDQNILWEGSLNILSHANTKEHLRRWHNKEEILAVIEKYALASCGQCLANHQMYGIGASHQPRSIVLGQLLTAYRIRQSLSQYTLAKRTRIQQARLSEIESGRNMTVSTLFHIADELSLEPVLVPKLLVPSVTQLLHRAIGGGP